MMDECELEVQLDDIGRAYSGFHKIDRMEISFVGFSGQTHTNVVREVSHRGHSVAVLITDPDTDEYLLIRQFLAGGWMSKAGFPNSPYQVPAGMIDIGETLYGAAIREIEEETGMKLVPSQLIRAPAIMPSPGGSSEVVFAFITRIPGCSTGDMGKSWFRLNIHENEDIAVDFIPRKRALEMIEDGMIYSAHTVSLIYYDQYIRSNPT